VLLLGALAAASNLAGGLLTLARPATKGNRQTLALAFSGGFLLSVAVLNILPESLRIEPRAPMLILLGYFLVYVSEHLFAGHAHRESTPEHGGHPLIGVLPHRDGRFPILPGAAAAATAGLSLHSFFDGASITAALAAGTPLGWLTFFAVLLHKLPEGFSQASISLASRASRPRAVAAAAGLGVACLFGSLVTFAVSGVFASIEGVVLAVACGMFLHISATDLLPTTARVRGVATLLSTVAGFATAAVASALLHRFLPR
jgi:zinc transporter ZupT